MIHKAKKSLGQNFLKSEPALNKMGEAGSVNNNDIVIEIGPGKGALTNKLLKLAKKVIAIEKDEELITILKERFTSEIESGKLELINDDILNINPIKLELKDSGYKIIANIPYNITGAILKKFLTEENKPENMILLVQKEVAERIVARDSKESILSLSVKAYGTPTYIMKVGKRFFSPSPKVDSAIIAIRNINRTNFINKQEEDMFFNIVKSGFAHKRKVLRKNLVTITEKEKIDMVFNELKIDSKTRAEDIKLNLRLSLTKKLIK